MAAMAAERKSSRLPAGIHRLWLVGQLGCIFSLKIGETASLLLPLLLLLLLLLQVLLLLLLLLLLFLLFLLSWWWWWW